MSRRNKRGVHVMSRRNKRGVHVMSRSSCYESYYRFCLNLALTFNSKIILRHKIKWQVLVIALTLLLFKTDLGGQLFSTNSMLILIPKGKIYIFN